MSENRTRRGPASVKQQKWWGWGAEGIQFSVSYTHLTLPTNREV